MSSTKKPRETMTSREAGMIGGQRRREQLSNEEYATMGKRGGSRTSERYGPEYMREIGRKGGQTLAASRGREYYCEIGKKGATRLHELIASKRRTEEK